MGAQVAYLHDEKTMAAQLRKVSRERNLTQLVYPELLLSADGKATKPVLGSIVYNALLRLSGLSGVNVADYAKRFAGRITEAMVKEWKWE